MQTDPWSKNPKVLLVTAGYELCIHLHDVPISSHIIACNWQERRTLLVLLMPQLVIPRSWGLYSLSSNLLWLHRCSLEQTIMGNKSHQAGEFVGDISYPDHKEAAVICMGLFKLIYWSLCFSQNGVTDDNYFSIFLNRSGMLYRRWQNTKKNEKKSGILCILTKLDLEFTNLNYIWCFVPPEETDILLKFATQLTCRRAPEYLKISARTLTVSDGKVSFQLRFFFSHFCAIAHNEWANCVSGL